MQSPHWVIEQLTVSWMMIEIRALLKWFSQCRTDLQLSMVSARGRTSMADLQDKSD